MGLCRGVEGGIWRSGENGLGVCEDKIVLCLLIGLVLRDVGGVDLLP